MRYIAPDHFTTGHWAPSGPLRFRTYTCLACGHRSPSWPAFKAHRRTCQGHMTGWLVPAPPPLTGDDLDRLAALYDQLREEDSA